MKLYFVEDVFLKNCILWIVGDWISLFFVSLLKYFEIFVENIGLSIYFMFKGLMVIVCC